MIIEAAAHLWNRYRPEEGWLSPILLFTVVVVMIFTILAAGWVPEDTVIVPSALLGLLLGTLLAKQQTNTWVAWTFLIIYGFLVTTLTLANLWPPLYLLINDWPQLRIYWLENGSFFLERADIWFTAVFAGSRSNETIIFAYLMGLMAWFLAAYAAWTAFRQRRPLLGLTFMGLIVALNGYYGEAPIETIIAFVGVAFLATAALHFSNLEWSWQRQGVDYSREIRTEMLLFATAIGTALLALAFLLPSFNPSKLARTILSQPVFASLEETWDLAFAGVDSPRDRLIPPGQAGGAGILPRSFLLGNPPELERNIMLSAETALISGPESATLDLARHWRGLSYEVYTGRGWALSDERTAIFDAGEPMPLPAVDEVAIIEQEVNWRFDNRVIRYTLGLPVSFDQPTTTFWRGQTDFVRAASADTPRYNAVSRISTATPDQLRQITIDDIHPAYIIRYARLPDDLPDRIADLAREVTDQAQTPYDQALALERFLRQYDYSLDVVLPPDGVDPVDFFLFDLQQGYCDYYASAMVVMARTLGLPARVATGFLAQPPDEEGVQIVRQINAHSWAEIYFGPYGWVEFEPTAAFITTQDPLYADTSFYADQYRDSPTEMQSVPIPERSPQRQWPWPMILMLAAGMVAIGSFLVWYLRRPRPEDEVQWAYDRLQTNAGRLGQSLPASQTPHEFTADLLRHLDQIGRGPRLRGLVERIWAPITRLTNLFVQQQYSNKPVDNPKRAVSLWRRIRRPLWVLWISKHLRR